MNSQRAKEILLLHRPGVGEECGAGSSGADPLVAEALTLAQHNPELGRWFEEHRALDSVIRASLRGITAPAGLAERILAAGRETLAPAKARWWRRSR